MSQSRYFSLFSMKTIALFSLLIFAFSVSAQTDSTDTKTDSTEIRLQRYKELHEKGLITDQEYDLLKKKELDISTVPKTSNRDTISLDKLKRTYKTQIIAGSLELATGITCIGLFIHYRNKTNTNSTNNNYLREARITLVFAGIFSGIGIYSLVKGSKNRVKYFERLSVSPSSVSVSLRF